MTSPELDKAEPLTPVWYQNLRGFIKGVFPPDERWKEIFLSELAASRERERALERERSQLAADIAGSQAAFAEERRDREAAEAEVKRLREALKPFAKIAEGEPDTLIIHTQHKIFRAAIRALADANTQGGDNAAE